MRIHFQETDDRRQWEPIKWIKIHTKHNLLLKSFLLGFSFHPNSATAWEWRHKDSNNKASSFLCIFASTTLRSTCLTMSMSPSSPLRCVIIPKLLRKWNGFFMTELYWHNPPISSRFTSLKKNKLCMTFLSFTLSIIETSSVFLLISA